MPKSVADITALDVTYANVLAPVGFHKAMTAKDDCVSADITKGLEGAQVGPVVVLCAVLYSQRVHIPLEVGEEGNLAISWLGKVLRAKIGKVHLVPVEVEREP